MRARADRQHSAPSWPSGGLILSACQHHKYGRRKRVGDQQAPAQNLNRGGPPQVRRSLRMAKLAGVALALSLGPRLRVENNSAAPPHSSAASGNRPAQFALRRILHQPRLSKHASTSTPRGNGPRRARDRPAPADLAHGLAQNILYTTPNRRHGWDATPPAPANRQPRR